MEVAPVHVWTEAHVKAHYTICVLSHLINRTLTLRLHRCAGDLTNRFARVAKLSNCMIDLIRVENLGLATYNALVKNPNCHPERSEESLRKTKCIIIADA